MKHPIYSMEIVYEQDVVQARKRCREITALLGFELQDQTRITTSLSELARNAFQYAGGGKVRFSYLAQKNARKPQLEIEVVDSGPGIAQLDTILNGAYRSPTGMGVGLLGARRLMEDFEVSSRPGSTVVRIAKTLPADSPVRQAADIAKIAGKLSVIQSANAFDELREQNQELIDALEKLRARESELAVLNDRLADANVAIATTNQELEETNRGVVALYAELDEKAEALKKANQLKTRFMSNMTHEFRTPLSSILGLSRLLLDRLDGPLTPEQEKQANFIRKAAEDLLELVNDMLDLAKVEAGKTAVRLGEFQVTELFGAMKGMMRPLVPESGRVSLIFEDVSRLPSLISDEAKISQVLRNLISNALKFTEAGEVRVRARMVSASLLELEVSDTGIGIAPEDQARLFNEYSQLDSKVQNKTKGTGLGLSLSKGLIELLGGRLDLRSRLGRGSTFTATFPVQVKVPKDEPAFAELSRPVLFFAAEASMFSFYSELALALGYDLKQVERSEQLPEQARLWQPSAVLLDASVGRALPSFAAARAIIPTAVIGGDIAAESLPGIAYLPSSFGAVSEWLKEHGGRQPRQSILIIDDELTPRYLLSTLLRGYRFEVKESASGAEGLEMATKCQPDLIFLDYSMPEMDGRQVLRALKGREETREIPVVIHTSKVFSSEEKTELLQDAIAIFPKENISRGNALKEIDWIVSKAGEKRRRSMQGAGSETANA